MSDDDEESTMFKAAMLNRVMDEGHFNQHITEEQAGPLGGGRAYAYTVGRSMFGRPEYLVTGLPREISDPLLDALVASDEEVEDAATLDGQERSLAVDGRVIRVKLMHASPVMLLGALVTFGSAVEAVQALWPHDRTYPSINDRWEDQPIHPHGVTPLTDGDPYA